MIYITHILLIMAAIWDIKKMEVPLTREYETFSVK